MTRRSGFTLIEIMAVIIILGILSVILVKKVTDQVQRARQVAAGAKIVSFQGAVQFFAMDNSRVPRLLTELVSKPADAKHWPPDGYLDGLRKVPKDPWGNEYFYRTPGSDGREYIIGSYGKDGKEGGEDWDKDLDCWKIQEGAE